MKRRTVVKAIVATPVLPVLASCSSSSASASNASSISGGPYSLVFDASRYTVKTKTVSGTGRGTRTVKYRFYEAIPYVKYPVDTQYQALNVSVPVEIDGKAVDASNAPICLDINVGGYMSSAVSGASGTGAPGGGTPPGGGGSQYGPGSSKGNGASAGMGTTVNGAGGQVDNGNLFLAAGWVTVSPGCRGRDNVKNGKYYGKAPAAIVDLKSAVRYIRYNRGRLPGNPRWIVATGGSAGGALSTLLAASADSPLYDSYLTALGAADVSDAIFASASYSPITDLDHADMSYEWMWGTLPVSGTTLVNQSYSRQLKTAFAAYQDQLGLPGIGGFGRLTAANYADYLLTRYLEPAATRYLAALSASARTTYLKQNSFITWSGGKATFSWEGFLGHVGTRMKSVPAFDTFDLSAAENIEFGDATTNARHFTLYSLRHVTGNPNARLATDLPDEIAMMNPMYFLSRANPSRAKNWWIRTGTLDTNTSHVIVGNLAAITSRLGDTVNSALYWDGGHAVNEDAADFVSWVATITGYRELQVRSAA